jgi:hypothetical protein
MFAMTAGLSDHSTAAMVTVAGRLFLSHPLIGKVAQTV